MADLKELSGADEGWRASTLLRRPVVHLEHVEHIGEVADIVFDTQSRTIAGILMGPAGAEGSVMDALRHLIGGTLGLTYVAAEDIVALNGDVVMIQPRPAHKRGRERLPSLRSAQGLSVVTMYGRRLGRFADLLLDDDGRAITGYLLDTIPGPQRQPGVAMPKDDTKKAEPRVIPAGAYLRVGHNLIALSERPLPAELEQVPMQRTGSTEWPGEPRATGFAPDAPLPPGEHDHFSPDAPTEELRGR